MSANEVAAYYSPIVVIPLAIWLFVVYHAANHPTVRHRYGARAGVLPVEAVSAADETGPAELRAAQQAAAQQVAAQQAAAQQAAAQQWNAQHAPADQARAEQAIALQAVAQADIGTGEPATGEPSTEEPTTGEPAEPSAPVVPEARRAPAGEPAPRPSGPGPAAPAAGNYPRVPAPRSAGAELPVPAQDGPYVDTQTLTDSETHVFETIATLEYTGQQASRDQIAAAAGFDDLTTDEILGSLVRRGLLSRSGPESAVAVYEPAQRNWSVTPLQARGL